MFPILALPRVSRVSRSKSFVFSAFSAAKSLRVCLNNQNLRAEVMVHGSNGWVAKEKRKDELTGSLGSGGQF